MCTVCNGLFVPPQGIIGMLWVFLDIFCTFFLKESHEGLDQYARMRRLFSSSVARYYIKRCYPSKVINEHMNMEKKK